MHVKAVYEHGVINLGQQIRFKREKFDVVVYIPDDELDVDRHEVSKQQNALSALDVLLEQTPNDPWLQRMKAIELAALSMPDEDIPPLSEQQLEHVQAFKMQEGQ